MLSGLLEVRPFGKGQFRRFMFFGQPAFLFGKTIPQTLYTWSPDAIGIEHSWGLGVYLAKGFEFRVTQHFLFDRLGARDRNLGPADLGNNGPWGRYNTIGVENISAREDGSAGAGVHARDCKIPKACSVYCGRCLDSSE